MSLAKWLSEGIVEYFSTSRLGAGKLESGRINRDTYPVWWIDELATSPDLSENIRNGSVISLKAIITNWSGPSMRREFNLYYLHWWTLTYFIFESAEYEQQALALVERGGDLESFELCLGPVENVERNWHAYVCQLKDGLSGKDLRLLKRIAASE